MSADGGEDAALVPAALAAFEAALASLASGDGRQTALTEALTLLSQLHSTVACTSFLRCVRACVRARPAPPLRAAHLPPS